MPIPHVVSGELYALVYGTTCIPQVTVSAPEPTVVEIVIERRPSAATSCGASLNRYIVHIDPAADLGVDSVTYLVSDLL